MATGQKSCFFERCGSEAVMSKRYSGKSFKDASAMKKPKLSLKEKRKLKREKKKGKN